MRVISRKPWRSKKRERHSKSLSLLEPKVISRNSLRLLKSIAPKQSKICKCTGDKKMVNFDLVMLYVWGIKRIFSSRWMRPYRNLRWKRSQGAMLQKQQRRSPTTSTKVCSIQMVWQIKVSKWSHKQVKTLKMQATCSNNAYSASKSSKIVKSTRETQIYRLCELSLKKSWRRWSKIMEVSKMLMLINWSWLKKKLKAQ